MRFSDRYGYTKVREQIQLESMDDALRNKLWSCTDAFFWSNAVLPQGDLGKNLYVPLDNLCNRIWFNYFKLPVDDIPYGWKATVDKIRNHFMGVKWYQCYNFIEFLAQNGEATDEFVGTVNRVLKEEVSAYRFIGNDIVPITDSNEIEAIESALAGPSKPTRAHIERALQLFANRQNPDYRNSIKESVSAIEALVKVVVGEKGTLGDLVKILTKQGLHQSLGKAVSNLYGYTSDEGGIRHALTEESATIDADDAKFMLVTCSAFINFFESKFASEASASE